MAEGSGSGWIKGCAIGCGVFVLLGILVVAGIYLLISNRINAGANVVQAKARSSYESKMETIEEGDLDYAAFKEVYEHSQREDLGYTAKLTIGGVVLAILDDDEITEDEVEVTETLSNLLKQEPNPGIRQIGIWLDTYPELQRYIQDIQMQGNYYQINKSTEITVDKSFEAPEELVLPSDDGAEESVEGALSESEVIEEAPAAVE